MQRIKEHLKFLANFALRPHRTGSIVPSSRALSRKMLAGVDFSRRQKVIEIGPGTGAVTQVILETLHDPSRYQAIELNQGFVKDLHQKFPKAKFHHDSAEHIARYATSENDSKDTYHIIASLPWSLLKPALQKRMLRGIADVMTQDSKFVTYAYLVARILPSGFKFEQLLQQYFHKVKISPVVWRNVPPAVVYHCEHPRSER